MALPVGGRIVQIAYIRSVDSDAPSLVPRNPSDAVVAALSTAFLHAARVRLSVLPLLPNDLKHRVWRAPALYVAARCAD